MIVFSRFFKYLFLFFGLSLFFYCEGSETGSLKAAAPPASSVGATVYDKNCKICHGADGSLCLNGAKDLLKSELPLPDRVQQITQGKNLMPPFGAQLTSDEIKEVALFTMQLKK